VNGNPVIDDPVALEAEAAYLEAADQLSTLSAQEELAMSGGPLYPTLEEWVREFFCVVFARHLMKVHWCAKWFDHEEALIRLDYLWFAFEDCRRKPGLGLAEWLTRHLDPQRQILLGPDGPFSGCGDNRHSLPPVLPTDPAPEGWWEMSRSERDELRKQKGWLQA
jgi:hypothetical protein